MKLASGMLSSRRALLLSILGVLVVSSSRSRSAGAGADRVAPTLWEPEAIASPLHDSAPAFTPDGATVYFGRSNGSEEPGPVILVSHRVEGAWTVPAVASFSGRHADMEPAIAPDGSHLVFVSNRPAHEGDPVLDGFFNGRVQPGGGGALWRVERLSDGAWSTPVRLPDSINLGTSTFAPAVAPDGSLYFMRPDETTGRFRLLRAQWNGAAYEEPQPLPFSDGTTTDVDPAVAPDESFLVFGSGRAPAADMDLFLVSRDPEGRWGEPVHLDPPISGPGSDAEPRLSPDGRFLYYSSVRTVPDLDAPWNNGKYNIWRVELDPAAVGVLRAAGEQPVRRSG